MTDPLTEAQGALAELRASDAYKHLIGVSGYQGTHIHRCEAHLLATIAALQPAPPPAAPLLDLRATAVKGSLPANPISVSTSPFPFDGSNDGLLYEGTDIQVVTDPRFGKVYEVTLNRQSHNPWRSDELAAGQISAELTKYRKVTVGETVYYAGSMKLVSPFTATSFGLVTQFGYPTLSSPPFGIMVSSAGVGLERNSGILTLNGSGYWAAEIMEKIVVYTVAQCEDVWMDWILMVTEQIAYLGAVELWTFLDGQPSKTVYNRTHTPTMQQRQGVLGVNSHEKLGLYMSSIGLPASFVKNTVLLRGTTIHSSYDEAEGSLA